MKTATATITMMRIHWDQMLVADRATRRGVRSRASSSALVSVGLVKDCLVSLIEHSLTCFPAAIALKIRESHIGNEHIRLRGSQRQRVYRNLRQRPLRGGILCPQSRPWSPRAVLLQPAHS